MKNQLTIKIIFSLLFIKSLTGNAQVSNTTNNSSFPNTHYSGWDNATGGQLMIKNESNNPINFLTNTGTGGTTPVRMTINGGGNIGFGITTPNYLLHQDGGANPTYHQFTNTTTFALPTDGFLTGIATNGIVEFHMAMEITVA